MPYELSKQEIIREVVKSGKDPVYFIDNFVKISHPLRGLIPFKLYDFQKEALADCNDHRFNIILKARQLGISTMTAAYVAWLMLFHRDKNVLVMATKLNVAANLVKKVKFIIKQLPPWLVISNIVIDNRNSFELDNGSQVKASSTSGDAGRSEALTLLVIDEAAIIEGMDELWAGLYPTLSTGGRCIAISTPFGVGNWFHKTYVEAEEEKNDFNYIKLPWHKHPERDHAWFEKETRNMSRREIAQELECNFNMSGETLLHPEDLEKLEKQVKEPKYKTGFDRNFWIWENYESGGQYLLSADVARGDGKDNSVFHVFRIDTMEIVAEYQGKLPIDDFARLIYDGSKEYGFCMTVVENNSIGLSVLDKLKELKHPNLYHSIKSTHEYIEQHLADARSNSIAGFSTTMKTRPLIISKLEEFIRNKLIKINSLRLYNELKTFVWTNGKAAGMRGYTDDLVMACAIGCWIRDTALVANKRDLEYKKAFANCIGANSTNLDTRIKGMLSTRQRDQFGNAIVNRNSRPQAQQPSLSKEFLWILKG